MLIAKTKGLEAVKKYINSQRHNFEKGFDWRLMPISNKTANQLLNGKFKTFEEFRDYSDDNINIYSNNSEILYKMIENKNKGKFDYIIETVFLNE